MRGANAPPIPAIKVAKPEVTITPPKPVTPPSISQVLKDQGYEGCDFLTQRGPSRVLFVCWRKMGGVLKTSFFHYDTSVLKTNKDAKVEASHIVGITYTSSSSATMKFEKGPKSVPLKNPPFWLSKWEGRGEVNPDNDCSLEKTGSNYTLKCGDKTGKKVEVQRGVNI